MGDRKHVRQRVVQNAGYAVDINIRLGVLGHVGMGLTSWCLSRDGWTMELSFKSRSKEQVSGVQVSGDQVSGSRRAGERSR